MVRKVIGVLITIVLASDTVGVSVARAQNVPDHIKKIVFDHLGFSKPVEITIWQPTFTSKYLPGIDWEAQNLWLDGFFIPKGYLKRASVQGFGQKEAYVVTEKSQRLARVNPMGLTDSTITIPVAKRVLNSIDYVKRRKFRIPFTGEETDAWSFTFTYSLSPSLPELPQSGTLKGKGTALLDPSDGIWKVYQDETALLGNEMRAYAHVLQKWQQEAIAKIQERFKMANLRFEYKKDTQGEIYAIEFAFDVEGGKSPYKYGDILLNGERFDQVFERVLSRYTVMQGTWAGNQLEKSWPASLYTWGRGDIREGISGHGSGGFWISTQTQKGNWPFAWPLEIDVPIRVKVTVVDSSSPPKTATGDVVVGPGLSLWGQTYVYGDMTWLERDGEPLYAKAGPSISLSGSWKGTFNYPSECVSAGVRDYCSKTAEFDLNLVQSGSRLTGTFTEKNLGEGPPILQGTVEGTLKGHKIVFEKRFTNAQYPSAAYKGFTDVRGNFAKGEWDIPGPGLARDTWSMARIGQAPGSGTTQPASSKEDDFRKLEAFIIDQLKQVTKIPAPKREWRELVSMQVTGTYDDYSSLYILGVNRRNLAADTLRAASDFLKKQDLPNAQHLANLGTRHYIESNELFKASDRVFAGGVGMTAQALEGIYRATKEASKYGFYVACGPVCYEKVDLIFLVTDFAVDYGLEGLEEAQRNLAIKAFVSVLLRMDGIIAHVQDQTAQFIGQSRLYNLLDKAIGSPDFQNELTVELAESGAYATRRAAEAATKKVVERALPFVRGSSQITPRESLSGR